MPIILNILIGSEGLGKALSRYLVYLKGSKSVRCHILSFDKTNGISSDILSAHLWLIEAWHPYEVNNPEGFRTAYALANKTRTLLFFLDIPNGFPEKGPFWTSYPSKVRLAEKIDEVLRHPVPPKEDYQRLLNLWPALGSNPASHHHHHSARRH